ncbi:MAG: hypothetical protein Q4F57_07500 [Weeksellaceae bacterium]|nr:hypothetical protein [Weeksellaceae bacterium]
MKLNSLKFNRLLASALFMTSLAFTTSCNDDDLQGGLPVDTTQPFMHVGYGVNYTDVAEGSVLPIQDLRGGSISFQNNGYSLEPARTHRFYSNSDGSLLYNLEYGNGNIVKYRTVGSPGFYQVLDEINVTNIIGTTHPRWKVLNDDTGLVYNIVTEHQRDENNNYLRTVSKIDIAAIGLQNLTIGERVSLELPQETHASIPNIHIWRIDMPVIQGNKVYFGVAKRGFDGAENVTNNTYQASTLVLDYPSLTNPQIINSPLGVGETYGYRTPSYITTETQDIYHVNMQNSKIFRIQNGVYDNSYDFDVAQALGMSAVGGTGIFYAGNGIAYMPFYDATLGISQEAGAWGVARIDLNSRTAIKMNTPNNMWLRYYQNAKIGADGKLYMALCPLTTPGNIYIFDPNQANPNGFELGSSLAVSGEGFYLGVF